MSKWELDGISFMCGGIFSLVVVIIIMVVNM
jgi:hypothetical protein